MRNTNYFLILFSIIFLAFLISGCSTTPSGQISTEKREIVKIGVIAPLTGDAAQWGEAVQNGISIVQDELKNDNTYFEYKFIIEDDQLQNAKTVTAFHKLNDIDRINALLSISSGSGNAVAPLAEQSKVIMFSAAASDPNVVKGRKYVFKHWVTIEAEGDKYIEEVQRRGFKTIGIIGTNQQGVQAQIGVIKKLVPDMILFDYLVDPNDKDFRTLILKASEKKPDTLLAMQMPGQVTAFMKQIQELNYSGDVSSIEMFEYEQEAIPYLEGRWYVNSAEAKGKFKQAYEEKFVNEPLVGSGNTYDSAKLLIQAYEAAKSTNPDRIAEELHKIKDYDGALGKLYIDEANSVQSQAVVKEIRNGTFVVVKE